MNEPKAFSEEIRGFRHSAGEAWELHNLHSRSVADRIFKLLAYLNEMEALVDAKYGVPVRDLRALDVGAGQRLIQLAYFSRANEVIGIDLGLIA